MTPRPCLDETGAFRLTLPRQNRLSARDPRTALFVQALVAASSGGPEHAVAALGRRLLDLRVSACAS